MVRACEMVDEREPKVVELVREVMRQSGSDVLEVHLAKSTTSDLKEDTSGMKYSVFQEEPPLRSGIYQSINIQLGFSEQAYAQKPAGVYPAGHPSLLHL